MRIYHWTLVTLSILFSPFLIERTKLTDESLLIITNAIKMMDNIVKLSLNTRKLPHEIKVYFILKIGAFIAQINTSRIWEIHYSNWKSLRVLK